ncbi:MAG TPA: hypothetical protein VGM90_14145 [Kofleriaceae bacterium]
MNNKLQKSQKSGLVVRHLRTVTSKPGFRMAFISSVMATATHLAPHLMNDQVLAVGLNVIASFAADLLVWWSRRR